MSSWHQCLHRKRDHLHYPTAGRLSALWFVGPLSSSFGDTEAALGGGIAMAVDLVAVPPDGGIYYGQCIPGLVFIGHPGYGSHHPSPPTSKRGQQMMWTSHFLVSVGSSLRQARNCLQRWEIIFKVAVLHAESTAGWWHSIQCSCVSIRVSNCCRPGALNILVQWSWSSYLWPFAGLLPNDLEMLKLIYQLGTMPVWVCWHIDDFAYWLGTGWVLFCQHVLVLGGSKPRSLKLQRFPLVMWLPSGRHAGGETSTAVTTAALEQLPS
jgi:hypothetical protein